MRNNRLLRWFLAVGLALVGQIFVARAAVEGVFSRDPFPAYTLELKAGEQVVVELESLEFQSNLLAELPDGRLLHHRGGSSGPSQLLLDLPEPGTVKVVVDATGSDPAGKFSLTAQKYVLEGAQALEPAAALPQIPDHYFRLGSFALPEVGEGRGLLVSLAAKGIRTKLVALMEDGRVISGAEPDDEGTRWLFLTPEQMQAQTIEAVVLTNWLGDLVPTELVRGKDWEVEAQPAEVEDISARLAAGGFDSNAVVGRYLAESQKADEAPLVLASYRVPVGPEARTIRLASNELDPALLVRMPDGRLLFNEDFQRQNSAQLELVSSVAGEAEVVACVFARERRGQARLRVVGDSQVLNPDPSVDGATILRDFLNPKREFEEALFFDTARTRAFADREGQPMPELPWAQLSWRDEPLAAEDLAGKVVVLDFWTTWCGPCIAAIPHNEELAKRHPEDLVILGLCLENDPALMGEILDEAGATYPVAYVAAEAVEALKAAWPIAFYPTYVVVDRRGVVRAYGLMPEHLTEVVEELLAEEGE